MAGATGVPFGITASGYIIGTALGWASSSSSRGLLMLWRAGVVKQRWLLSSRHGHRDARHDLAVIDCGSGLLEAHIVTGDRLAAAHPCFEVAFVVAARLLEY